MRKLLQAAWWTATLQLPARLKYRRIIHDRARLLTSSPLFDAEWYRATYADVAAAGVDPALHFVLTGPDECRNPGPGFDFGLVSTALPGCRRSAPESGGPAVS